MDKFRFTVEAQVTGTRHTARKIQESLVETMENWSYEQGDLIARARGMSVNVSTVQKVKAGGE